MKATGGKEFNAQRFHHDRDIIEFRNGITMLDQMKKKGLAKYGLTQKEYAAKRADLEAKLKKAQGSK